MPDDPLAKYFDELVPGKRPRRVQDAPKVETKDAEAWDANPVEGYLNGEQVEFFTIGALAAALGKSPITIRYWEDKSVFPLARYRAGEPRGEQAPGKKKMGKRLYTRAQIEVVVAAARHTRVLGDPRKADWSSFTALVIDGWRKLG